MSGIGQGHVSDLRYGSAPVPVTGNGYDPAGDAAALIIAGTPSPAANPIPGVQVLGSRGTDERYVIRVPDAWNGKLVVVGTPAFRSEFANDAIWSDFLLANGYECACSNRGAAAAAAVRVVGVQPAGEPGRERRDPARRRNAARRHPAGRHRRQGARDALSV